MKNIELLFNVRISNENGAIDFESKVVYVNLEINKNNKDRIIVIFKNVASERLINAKQLKEKWDVLDNDMLFIGNKSIVNCIVPDTIKVSCNTPILLKL